MIPDSVPEFYGDEQLRINSGATTFHYTPPAALMPYPLIIQQDTSSMHHGTSVWPCTFSMIQYLLENSKMFAGKRVAELGSGCGLLGCLLAAVKPTELLLTDQEEIIPLLHQNLKRNLLQAGDLGVDIRCILDFTTDPIPDQKHSSDAKTLIRVQPLNWLDEAHYEKAAPPFDVVLGTDVLYSVDCIPLLLKTMFALTRKNSTCLIAYENRDPQVLEGFKKELEEMKQNNERCWGDLRVSRIVKNNPFSLILKWKRK